MSNSPSELLADHNTSTPWALMVLHLSERHCLTKESGADSQGNISIPLTSCRMRVQQQGVMIDIELLSVTLASIIFTAIVKFDHRSQFRMCHLFLPTFRQWWQFSVKECALIGGNPREYRYEATLDDPAGVSEILVPTDDRRIRMERRDRTCRRLKST